MFAFRFVLSRAQRIKCSRVARLTFLTPNFTDLAFFGSTWRQKIVWLFLFNIWLFWRQLAHTIRLVFWLCKYLAEAYYSAFLDSAWCVFLKVIWQLIKE